MYLIGYIILMLIFVSSSDFDAWLAQIADLKAKARILARLRSASFGNFGDCESVGEGVSEMRVHIGPGYRVYFTRRGTTLYVLLTGGDKSTQKRDIVRAKSMAKDLKDVAP
jgi:putative addiction module killer protein